MSSPDIGVRVQAIRQAAATGDLDALPHLVDRLEDEDPVVRFAAILALQDLTGLRLGYSYGQDSAERAAAVALWREYLQARADRTRAGKSSGRSSV